MKGEPSLKVSRCGTLFVLFWEMILLAAFVLGGGYVILSVADRRFSRKKWIREGELFEALPLFQMIPGIIGGHTAVYLGNRVAGLVGSAVALAGMVLPSVLIFLAISLCYTSIPVGSPLMSALFLGLRAALSCRAFSDFSLRMSARAVHEALSTDYKSLILRSGRP